MINRGMREFVLDLEECPVMDSTFMGTVTYVATRLLSMGQGGVTVINTNERNFDLLQNLGMDQLMDVHKDDAGFANAARECSDQPLATPTLSKEERAELMLEAHEALSDLSPENERKFKDVIEFLRQDLNLEVG